MSEQKAYAYPAYPSKTEASDLIEMLEAENAALRAENERLRAALKPFAAAQNPQALPQDFDRARRALERKPE